ncbi:hypothetical protein SAMN05443429_10356 [Cruoricaptor ignavus]|uniref:Uncharacterized protein n=1 Tax=Cruoricaptor ignavus TaxID=1118202 RepID=A0A1M6CZD7_9FLAO|nr:DUF2683 family protein [Cruoricaptor ignavus]SHI66088.1 hypothetical protein SAMN05443429_10356 [Cruoricaptor ignavus]
MEDIIISPESKKQSALLKSLFKEMNLDFRVKRKKDETKMTKEEFFAKIEKSRKQAEEGKSIRLTPELKQELFKSIL